VVGGFLSRSPGLSRGSFTLVVFVISFSAGAAAGFLFGSVCDNSDLFADYLKTYFNDVSSGRIRFSFFRVFWDCLRWPALLLICSISGLRYIGVPTLLLVRGFLLSYSVSVLTAVLGKIGILLSMSLFGINVFLQVPLLLFLALESFDYYAEPARQKHLSGFFASDFFVVLVISFAIIVLAVVIQWTAVPAILIHICSKL